MKRFVMVLSVHAVDRVAGWIRLWSASFAACSLENAPGHWQAGSKQVAADAELARQLQRREIEASRSQAKAAKKKKGGEKGGEDGAPPPPPDAPVVVAAAAPPS